MYLTDFQVCLQNMAYGEVFNSQVPYREPPDKRVKVITMDPENLEDLHHFFQRETKWGKNAIQYEKEADEKYSPNNGINADAQRPGPCRSLGGTFTCFDLAQNSRSL